MKVYVIMDSEDWGENSHVIPIGFSSKRKAENFNIKNYNGIIYEVEIKDSVKRRRTSKKVLVSK